MVTDGVLFGFVLKENGHCLPIDHQSIGSIVSEKWCFGPIVGVIHGNPGGSWRFYQLPSQAPARFMGGGRADQETEIV